MKIHNFFRNRESHGKILRDIEVPRKNFYGIEVLGVLRRGLKSDRGPERTHIVH